MPKAGRHSPPPAPLTPDGPLEAPRVFAGLCFLLRDE
jgi:hypothetical protein